MIEVVPVVVSNLESCFYQSQVAFAGSWGHQFSESIRGCF